MLSDCELSDSDSDTIGPIAPVRASIVHLIHRTLARQYADSHCAYACMACTRVYSKPTHCTCVYRIPKPVAFAKS